MLRIKKKKKNLLVNDETVVAREFYLTGTGIIVVRIIFYSKTDGNSDGKLCTHTTFRFATRVLHCIQYILTYIYIMPARRREFFFFFDRMRYYLYWSCEERVVGGRGCANDIGNRRTHSCTHK